MQLVRKQVLLDEESIPKLSQVAESKGVSVSAIVRWAVDHYLQAPIFLPSDLVSSTVELIQQPESQAA